MPIARTYSVGHREGPYSPCKASPVEERFRPLWRPRPEHIGRGTDHALVADLLRGVEPAAGFQLHGGTLIRTLVGVRCIERPALRERVTCRSQHTVAFAFVEGVK